MIEGLQTSYDSIAAAAAALSLAGVKCSKAALRKAKKEGAPGFRGSRVYPAELVPWLQAKDLAGRANRETRAEASAGDAQTGLSALHEDKDTLEARRLRLQCEGLEIANAEKRGLLWDANHVKASWLTHLRVARQALIAMATDLAPRIAGRPPIEAEALLREAVDGVLARLRGNPYGEGPVSCPGCGYQMKEILVGGEVGSAAASPHPKCESKAKGKGKGKKHVRKCKEVGGDRAEDGGIDPGAVRADPPGVGGARAGEE